MAWRFMELCHMGHVVRSSSCFGKTDYELSFYKNIPSFFRWALTMLIVIIGWVFFKAETLPAAWAYIMSMAGIGNVSPEAGTFFVYLLS